MKTVHSALVVDSNDAALSVERQLSIALAKALSRKARIASATLVGWPFLLVRVEENGGYMVFDETGMLEAEVVRKVFDNHAPYIEKLSYLSSAEDFLASISSHPWQEERGEERIRLRGVVERDIMRVLNSPSVPLTSTLLPRRITGERAMAELEEWRRVQAVIKSDLERLSEHLSSFSAVSEAFIGKVAEERRRTEAAFNADIATERSNLEDLLKQRKPKVYEEVKRLVEERTPRLAEIYGILVKAQLDAEGGILPLNQLSSLVASKDRVLRELEESINSAIEPFKAEVREFRERIEGLEAKKREELGKLDEKLKSLREAVNGVKEVLGQIRRSKEEELTRLSSLPRRSIFTEEQLEVVVPFLSVSYEDGNSQVFSPMKYNGRNRSFLGFGSKVDSIASPLEGFLRDLEGKLISTKLPDNVKPMREELEKGVEWVETEGWRVRKLLEEYYL
jgi:hypothetical protein